MKTKGLDRGQLKLIAILAMVIDHTAWGFVEFLTPLGQAMHIFGRLTLPIMCFFVAEGFRHTKDLKRYFYRMMTFAVIAAPLFWVFFHQEYGYRQNIIFDLTLALMALAVSEHKAFAKPLRIFLIALLILTSLLVGGWVVMPIVYVLIFYYSRDFKTMAIRFIVATCLLQAVLLPTILFNERFHILPYDWTVTERLYLFGFVLALIPLYFYNGKKGQTPIGRYFFYIFYPAHFLVLTLIRYLMTSATPQGIYIIAHIAALFIGFALLIYVLTRKVSRAQMSVTFLLSVSIMYIFGFLLEITSSEVAGVYTATKLQYFAECLVMIAVTMCTQELCHFRFPSPVYALQIVTSIFTMHCMFTWEKNGLMYSGISIDRSGPFPRMNIEGYGVAFYLFLIYCFIVCLMVVIVGFRSSRNSDAIQKKRLRLLLYAMISMWFPSIVKAFDLAGGYEFPALFIPIAAAFITTALVKYSYLDSVSLGFSNAVNQGREGILIIDNNHRILYFNDWVQQIFGKLTQYDDAFRLRDVRDAFNGLTDTLSRNDRTYELRVEPLVEQGHNTGEILWIFDLTEHYRYLERMKEEASRDPLTGLSNRAWFENAVRSLLAEKTSGGFFMADLDHFKQVNDSYGHQVGDDTLVAFATAVRDSAENTPENALIVGRFGGDEFCLFYRDVTDREALAAYAAKLIGCFDRALARAGHEGITTLSLGITVVNTAELPVSVWTSYTRIHDQADQALYAAKEAGRKTWRFYDSI
ncbi:MAG: diguanylate cyclase [Lachnospiraceae bacterium]|nr:diguanylate cyclase [Lachnospiraceae bacterium]